MPTQIRITGNLVELVETSILRTVSLEEFLPHIERRVAVALPVLPSQARAAFWDPRTETKSLVIMLEREPFVANLDYSGNIHRVTIPWTRMLFHCTTPDSTNESQWRMDDYKIFWAPKRYSDPNESDMVVAALPNVYGDGRICFGSTGVDGNQPLADRLDQTLNEFYASTFNNDLRVRYPNAYRNFAMWATATINDHTCWNKWSDFTSGPGSSWNMLISEWAVTEPRNVPVASSDPIPPLAMSPSFGRVWEWFTSMPERDQAILRRAIIQAPQEPTDG